MGNDFSQSYIGIRIYSQIRIGLIEDWKLYNLKVKEKYMLIFFYTTICMSHFIISMTYIWWMVSIQLICFYKSFIFIDDKSFRKCIDFMTPKNNQIIPLFGKCLIMNNNCGFTWRYSPISPLNQSVSVFIVCFSKILWFFF